MSNKQRSSHMPFSPQPVGKHLVPSRAEQLSNIESKVMAGLDPEKLSELAEVLFAFNNYRVGPMPGFYVAVEIQPGEQWCVGQLCADRAKPLKLFDDKPYKTARGAQKAAERMRDHDRAGMAGN